MPIKSQNQDKTINMNSRIIIIIINIFSLVFQFVLLISRLFDWCADPNQNADCVLNSGHNAYSLRLTKESTMVLFIHLEHNTKAVHI